MADVVFRLHVATHLENELSDHLLLFTDAAGGPTRNSATVAATIPSLGCDWTERLSIVTSSTAAELVAIRLARQKLNLMEPLKKLLILSVSRAALLQLKNGDRGCIFARAIPVLCQEVEDTRWSLSFQWVPSHCGVSGKVQADALPASTNPQSTTIYIDRLFEVYMFIDESMRRCHPDEDVARGCIPSPVPHNHITKASASLLRRLRGNRAFAKKTLHLIGKGDSPHCDVCGDVEDVHHVILTCTQYASERISLRGAVNGDGRPSESLRDFLFPTGPSGSVLFVFRTVTAFLANSSVDMCL